ncbi:MAG: methylenetetrahydrofolate reductase C-terminal domain-containing protein [Halobacteriota archaeon]|nr:methylenetetrahydrofolate reductase C-terminal domain-containing protein [Halobacteriota archaeon]
MIITKEKPIEEIVKYLEPFEKILIVGCDGCTQPPRGLREAETYASLIEMALDLKGKNVECAATTVVRQCCNDGVKNWVKPDEYDAVLSMACGIGVQILTQVFPKVPVFPAQNTVFIGSEEKREGAMYEMCMSCGDCLLAETGGICPVTRCAKGLMNGPCGGCVEGKCEVPAYKKNWKGEVIETVNNDCAWYLIYNRLKEMDKLEQFRKYRPPRDRSISIHPRVL